MVTARFKQRHILLLISVVLAAATAVAYEPIRHNGFVNYDDARYITANPDVKAGITWQSLGRAFARPHYYMWHPLTTLMNMLDYELFGMNAFGHHIVSLLLHIISAILLFIILSDMTRTIWPSAFVAAVFALHPVQVESVAWAAELKTVLSGLFWLLTIAAYVRYTKQPRTGYYVLMLLVFGLCILTKPTVVTLPFVLLLLDYWPLGRTRWGHQIIEKIPLFVLSLILSVITFIAQRQGGAVVPLEKMPLDSRVANMFVSYMRYIGKTIWPSRLAVFYPPLPTSFPKTVVVICAFLFILLTALSIYVGRHRRYIAVGWLWYIGTLVPTIGLVQSGAQAMANRYMYVPMLGLLIIIAWTVRDLIINRPRWKAVPLVLATVVLPLMVILTWIQVRHWQNSMTLFEYTLKVSKNNSIAENGYGGALFEAGRIDEAVLHLSNAVRISPALSDARNNLGKIFLKQGKFNEAVFCFNELINRKKGSAEVYYNLGVAFSMQRKYNDAAKCFAKALELDPKYPDARRKLGAVLLVLGKTDEAITHFNEALRMNADRAEVYANLGTAYNQLGKYELAIQNWNKSIEIEPNSANVLNDLAWLLATTSDVSIRDADKAVELAKRACELTNYENPGILDTLAAAFASDGRFGQAIETIEKALELCQSTEQSVLKKEIENHLVLYKADKPYVETR